MKENDHNTLLRTLTALDFIAVDLALYLDTHPYDEDALATYNEIIQEANRVRDAYERKNGPLCSYRSFATNGWDWVNGPWPWQNEANYRI